MNCGLFRIILIDAMREGVTCEIPLEGHTNLTGNNDSGKTTLIKLGPLFYGESPLAVGIKKKTGSLKSFASWYLPRSGSSIIYEYLKEGEKRCLWFHGGSDEDSFIRVFIESEFKKDLFVDPESHIPYQPDEVKKRLKLQNIFTHQCKSFEEHKQILLDGKNKLTTFAMVPLRTRLSKLTTLFSGMLTRNTKFDELSKIIEGWCKGDIDSASVKNLENFKLDRSSLLQWQHDYHSLSIIQRNISNFDELSAKLTQFKDTKNELASFYHQASNRQTILKEQIDKQTISCKKENLYFDEELKAISDKSQTEVVTSTEKLVREITAEIDNLVYRHSNLRSQLGEQPELRLVALKGLNTSVESVQKDLDIAKSGAEGIGEWYSGQKNILGEKFRAQERSLSQLYGDTREEKNQALLDLGQSNAEEKEGQLNKFLSMLSGLTEQLKLLEINKLNIESIITAPPANLHLLNSIANLREVKTKTDQTAGDKHNLNVSSRKKLEALDDELISARKLLKIAEDDEDYYRNDLLRYQGIKDAKDGTLLSYLKTNIDGWEDTFGKLIHLDILQNRNLMPELVKVDNSAVFGVSMDVSKLPQADYPTEEVLTEKINVLSTQVSNALVEIDTHDKKVGQIRKSILLLKKDVSEVEAEYQALKQKSQGLDNKINNHLQEIKEEKISLVEQKKIELASVIVFIIEINDAIKTEKNQKDKDVVTLTKKHEDHVSRISAQFDVKLQKINKQKYAMSIDEKTEHDALENNKTIKLSDAGFDTQFITAKEAELKGIKENISILEKLQSIFDNYTEFKNAGYAELPSLQQDQIKAKACYEEAKLALEGMISRSAELERLIRENDKQHDLKVQALNTDISALQNNIIEYAKYKYMPTSEHVELGSVQQLLRAFTEKTNALGAIKSQMTTAIASLRDMFQERPGTPPHAYWASNLIDVYDIENSAIKLVDYVKTDALNKDIRILVDSLGQLEKIRTYCSYLEEFEKRVNGFSRQLSPYLERGSGFHGLERLEARILFNLSETQAWEDIKHLTSEFESWSDDLGVMSNHHRIEPALPPESFVDAMERFTNAQNVDELGINDLYRYIEFRIEVMDKGILKRLQSHTDFGDVSSNGTSYLIMLVLFISFIKMHKKAADVNFVWALDELTNIDSTNIHTLFDLLNESNITLLSACPEVNHAIFHRFSNTRRLNSNGTGHLEILDVAKTVQDDWVSGFIGGAK